MAKFGYRTNSMGYRELPACVRVIQGDGIALDSIAAILAAMTAQGQSAANVAFGMGGELLQKVNRDSLKFAMKASAVRVNGQWRDVFKDPVTDPGKTSKKGRLALRHSVTAGWATVRADDPGFAPDQLVTLFENGELLRDFTLEDVRAHAALP
jgi:nicotinamide phosphoribosyltransferase